MSQLLLRLAVRSYEEIAPELGCAPDTVRWLEANALRKMRRYAAANPAWRAECEGLQAMKQAAFVAEGATFPLTEQEILARLSESWLGDLE